MLEGILEEEYWLMSELNQTYDVLVDMPVYERKWYFDRLIRQREREAEEQRKAMSKRGSGGRHR